jgi:hypothetical protein
MLERLAHLEYATATTNTHNCNNCNKCNKCNDDATHDPFAFNAIYSDNYKDVDDECPALDLITNHYADFVPATDEPVPAIVPIPAPVTDDDNDDDNDFFELIQIELVPNFSK